MQKVYIQYIILLMLSIGLQTSTAQELRYCYNIIPGTNNTDTLTIGLQALNGNAIPIRAINISFAFDTTCSDSISYSTILEDASNWGSFFSSSRILRDRQITYQGRVYNGRLLYANADPRPMAPNPFMLPAGSSQPLIVFRAIFRGSCSPEIYLENESENPLNQVGSVDNIAIPYVVDHLPCAPVSNDLALPAIGIWPNPGVNGCWMESAVPLYFEIFGTNGKLEQKGMMQGKQKFFLKNPGLYVVRFTDSGGRSLSRKIIIK